MKVGNYSLIALAVCASLAVNAQEAVNLKDVKDIERIIVIGSRMQESIDEVPASVSIIDNQTITQDLLTTAELQTMLALHVPGMGADTGTNSNSGQSLRGRNALVMIDGAPQSTPLGNGKLGIRSLDQSVIERIEVIVLTVLLVSAIHVRLIPTRSNNWINHSCFTVFGSSGKLVTIDIAP